ncbi:MAG: sodium-extruding oxaloacetate decarboxylase subunit alpha [Endomicrobia bacterium]|nr:sodium-extruding oxaloacetate decarboxylase subunit alpha [Endomicrobiia bacterium]
MIKIIDTTLRDAHQSLIATRMRTDDMLPILEKLDEVGFFSLEVWGGATFDACLRYLAEDPWERLRKIRQKVKKTKLQMLLRGQNLVGYRHYADDVVEKFIYLCVENGIDVIRIFDALNDVRNMEMPIKFAKKARAIVQGTISYTTSPVHTIEAFVKLAKEFENLGCDYVCIKDMAGLISPKAAYALVKAIKENVKLPVDLHTHMTSGMGMLSYYAACQAGVDIVDCAFSACAGGTSQPPMESFVASLKGTPYDPQLDIEKLVEIGYYFLNVRKKYESLFSPVAERSDVSVLIHQIPGGMISNLYSQLKEQKALDKYQDVLKEVPKVREDLGYPPLVTPTSQIVGTQAVLNVLTGERYKKVTEEVKNYCLGLYGKPPGEIKPEILQKIIPEKKPITCRPADLLEPELEKIKKEIKDKNIPIKTEEEILTYALFPQLAEKFFKGEIQPELLETPQLKKQQEVKQQTADSKNEFVVEVDGEEFLVKIKPVETQQPSTERVQSKREEKPGNAVLSPMQGMVISIKVKVGDKVKKGDTLIVLEAMKMQTEIHSDKDGIIKKIYTYEGEIVDVGEAIVELE